MNSKSKSPNNLILWILVGVLVLAGIIALVMSFRGGESGQDEVNAVYTNAAATLAVQQLTLQASVPSATSTTSVVTSTSTAIPLVTSTALPTIAQSNSGSTGGASGAVGCNNSVYVSDVTIPDDTVVTPGQAITKTWKLQNNGSCAWTATYKVSFLSGNAMSGVATPIGITVQPGASADITVALKAPATAGDAIGYWILTNDSNQNFGSNFYIKVKVGGAGTTGTTTATATATATTVAAAPVPANNPTITLSCALEGGVGPKLEYAGTLTWEDKSNNETGFNVYVNGSLATATGANATSYVVAAGTFLDPNTPVTYSVEAFNNTGKAAIVSVIKQCP